MGIFSNKELCKRLVEYIEVPHLTSSLVLDMFHNRAEHITIQCVQAGVILGKRQSKHIREFCIMESTPLERSLDGMRMSYITLEDCQHETHQATTEA